MLADETAITSALQRPTPTQPSPEEMHDPKNSFELLLSNSECGLSPATAYAAIAQILRLEILIDRCPNGFAPFADRLRRIHH